MGYRYDKKYLESVTLRNGDDVLVRLILPEDKPLFKIALRNFSEESLFLRFMTKKTEFSRSELEYLTEVDQINHVALAAGRMNPLGPEGLGVARFVRFETDPETADFAVFIGDPVQRQGLGRAMLLRIAAAARERGIKRFSGEMLARNTAMFHLVDTTVPMAEWLLDGETLSVSFELRDVPRPKKGRV